MSVTSVKTQCSHCKLPVPDGLVDSSAEHQFCCSGCKMAYQLINSCGLDSFYSMVEHSDQTSANSAAREDGFEEFDRESFLKNFAKPLEGGLMQITLLLDGIHCAACIWLLEKLPNMLPGVLDANLNWARQSIKIRWDASEVSLSTIARTLSRLGYFPHPVRVNKDENRRINESRKHLIGIGIAGAAAGNNMLIALALYLSWFSEMGSGMTTMMRVASCFVGMVSLAWPGRVFLRGAWNAIKTRTAHMDLPIALGLGVGSIAGLVNVIRGTGEIYFDSLSVLVFLLLVGRWIQFRQQGRAADAVELLYRLTPKNARKLVDGELIDTYVDMVEVGDKLEIRPGELIPVDGEVIDGHSEVDESILTGESRLVAKSVGSLLMAGTKNQGSVLRLQTKAIGDETRLSKIVELVEQASHNKPQIVQWANRIGGYFVVTIISLAVLTLIAWLYWAPALAVDRAVALLIVACPCALAIATPLAISVALGRAASRKMMIKGGDVLQVLNQPGMIWLDKTGTLTEGHLEIVNIHEYVDIGAMAVALESNSNHPVARAFVKHFKFDENPVHSFSCVEFVEHEGMGVSGRVNDEDMVIGNQALLQYFNIEVSERDQNIADQIINAELSPCWIACDGKIAAIAAIGDQLRNDSLGCISQLKSEGWQIGILSGDHQSIVDQVATRLGIAREFALGQLSPEEKVAQVQHAMEDYSTVVMVGDGVNDSAALAAATVGIAVHGGAEASLAAAPVFLGQQGLAPIQDLLSISRSTARTLRWNFAIAIGYNCLGATLAFFGLINPLVAAILMPISSLSVVAMSLHSGKIRGNHRRVSRMLDEKSPGKLIAGNGNEFVQYDAEQNAQVEESGVL